jgi:hypothetical protein
MLMACGLRERIILARSRPMTENIKLPRKAAELRMNE